MSKTSKTNTTPPSAGATQFIVPAIVGAVVAAIVFALFFKFSPPAAENSVANTPAATTQPNKTEGDTTGLSKTQRAEVEETIKEYLLDHPEVLLQMTEALEKYQIEQREKRLKTAIEQNADAIYRESNGLMGGNPEGDVTIVEFSDYNCPYCKRAFQSLTKLIDTDKKVRVVFKELPIFGERSEGAARVAIAAREQNKYFELHAALLRNRGQNNAERALKIAEGLGLDIDKLRQDMNSEEVTKIIRDTREIGNELGIQGTPFYLVGDQVIPGAPENLYEVLVEKVSDIRKNGCQTGC